MDTHLARQLPNDIIIRIIREATEADTMDYWMDLHNQIGAAGDTAGARRPRARQCRQIQMMRSLPIDLHVRGYLGDRQYNKAKAIVRRATDEELDAILLRHPPKPPYTATP